MERLSEGAEAIIYKTDFLGMPALIKRRISKDYREKKLDENIRTTRTKKEAKILSVLSDKEIYVPSLLMITKFDIYLSVIKGKRLSTFYDQKKEMKKTFARIGESLATIHNSGISHGDYTPANIIVENEKVGIIDFGLADITHSIEDKAMDIILMKRSINPSHYSKFISAYKQKSTDPKPILKRVEDIEKRGRYIERSLKTA